MKPSLSVLARDFSTPSVAIRRAAGLAVALAATTASAQTNSTYVGPNNGFWSVDANWSTPNFPQNGTPAGTTYDAFIDGGNAANTTVILEGGLTRTISNLTISAGDGLSVTNNTFLNLAGDGTTATLANAGTLTLNSTGSSTRLQFVSTGGTINGGGTINLVSGAGDIAGALNSSVTNADNLIVGTGNVGLDSVFFTNAAGGNIRASAGTLTLDPRNANSGLGVDGSEFRNLGTLSAIAGGTLVLTGSGGGEFNNTGGTISANGGNVTLTTSAVVTGGTLTRTGTSVVEAAASQDVYLQGITNTGEIVARTNSDLGVAGTIANNGLLRTEGTADLEIQGDTTITAAVNGGNVIQLGNTTTGINGTLNSTLTLRNNVVTGTGAIGQDQIYIDNAGSITANTAGQSLTLDPRNSNTGTGVDGGELLNTGSLRADFGGNLILTGSGGGEFRQTGGGLISAQNNSSVTLTTNADVTGGRLITVGSGFIEAAISQNVYLRSLANEGRLIARTNSDLGIAGTITNTGSITIEGTADLETQGDTTVAGVGTIVLNTTGSTGINGLLNDSLTLAAGQTVTGRGEFGQDAIYVSNAGTIEANVAAATLTLNPRNANTGTGVDGSEFRNTGTLRASGTAELVLTGSGGGEFNNAGATIEAVGGGSVVTLTTTATVTGGTLRGTGGGVVQSGISQDIVVGDLTLEGAIFGRTNSDFGVTGTITNNGTLTIEGSADAEAQAAGVTFAGTGQLVLATGGTTGLNGVLNVTVVNGASHTIRGLGELGQDSVFVQNNGVVAADQLGGTLVVNPRNSNTGLGIDGSEFDNNGILRAVNGATLSLSGSGGGEFDNAGGTIEALAGSTVQVVTGGQVMQVDPQTASATDDRVTAGTFRAINGTLNVSPAGFDAASNAGTIELGGTAANTDLFNEAGGSAGNINSARFATNTGSFRVTGGATFTTTAGPLQTSGDLLVGAGSTLTAPSVANAAGGVLRGEGTIAASTGVTNAGTLRPGDAATGADAGLLTIVGDLTLAGTSALSIEIGGTTTGTTFDDVQAQNVTLGGILSLALFNGFVPASANTFTIVDSIGTNTLSGAFTNVANGGRLLVADGSGSFAVNYGPTSAFNHGDVVLSDFQLVPEPTTLAALGSMAVVALRRRRRVAAGV